MVFSLVPTLKVHTLTFAGEEVAYLKSRTGFVRIAIQNGAGKLWSRIVSDAFSRNSDILLLCKVQQLALLISGRSFRHHYTHANSI